MTNPEELERAVERVGIIIDGMRTNADETEKQLPASPTRDLLVREMRTRADALALILAAYRKMREAAPDLTAVIAWLKNGCDPAHAVTELQIYQDRLARSAISTKEQPDV